MHKSEYESKAEIENRISIKNKRENNKLQNNFKN